MVDSARLETVAESAMVELMVVKLDVWSRSSLGGGIGGAVVALAAVELNTRDSNQDNSNADYPSATPVQYARRCR